MRKIAVIGLGLIGGSMAKAIHEQTDCEIIAYDWSEEVMAKAQGEGVVSQEATPSNLSECDMMIVALYPRDVIPFIENNYQQLKKGCIIVDCTGIKAGICKALSQKLSEKGLCFIGGHPMAGKEVAGYDNATPKLFHGATMILCKDEYTDADAYKRAKEFFLGLGFSSIKETTAEEHDNVIAYTSQMAHVVSSAYIKSDVLSERYGFSAGSFKDLTRVARLNEDMWTDLFLENREALLKQLDEFLEHMQEYREAIAGSDGEHLRKLLREGRICKETDELMERRISKETDELMERRICKKTEKLKDTEI